MEKYLQMILSKKASLNDEKLFFTMKIISCDEDILVNMIDNSYDILKRGGWGGEEDEGNICYEIERKRCWFWRRREKNIFSLKSSLKRRKLDFNTWKG